MRLMLPCLLLAAGSACVFNGHHDDATDSGTTGGVGDFGGSSTAIYEHDCGQDGQQQTYDFTWPVTVTPGETMPEAVLWTELSPTYRSYLASVQTVAAPTWYAGWGISTDENGRLLGGCSWVTSPVNGWYADRLILVVRSH